MNRLIAFVGVVATAAAVLPSICVPDNDCEIRDALKLNKLMGGVTC